MESCDDSYINPANLSLYKQRKIELSYYNQYELIQLSTYNIIYQQPTKTIDFTLLMSYYGYENYNETACGLNVSKLLTTGLSLGIRIYYFKLDFIDNENTYGLLTTDIGIKYSPVDKLEMSCLLINPFRVSFKADNEIYNMPVSFIAGIKLNINEFINTYTEVRKNTDNTINYKIGAEGSIYEKFFIRAGVITNPLIPTFGVGLKSKKIIADTFFSWHNMLGISSGISLSFVF